MRWNIGLKKFMFNYKSILINLIFYFINMNINLFIEFSYSKNFIIFVYYYFIIMYKASYDFFLDGKVY